MHFRTTKSTIGREDRATTKSHFSEKKKNVRNLKRGRERRENQGIKNKRCNRTLDSSFQRGKKRGGVKIFEHMSTDIVNGLTVQAGRMKRAYVRA